jgi:hypothetical protein
MAHLWLIESRKVKQLLLWLSLGPQMPSGFSGSGAGNGGSEIGPVCLVVSISKFNKSCTSCTSTIRLRPYRPTEWSTLRITSPVGNFVILGIVSSPWRSLTYMELSAKRDGKFIR